MRIVIVGADESRWRNIPSSIPKDRIRSILRSRWASPILVSGRCPKGGIDVWMEEINEAEYHYPTEIYPPRSNAWPYFRERNIKMAKVGDVLYCISRAGVWDGGRWTARYFQGLGKPAYVIEI